MGGEVEVGVVLVGVCPGRIASSAFLLSSSASSSYLFKVALNFPIVPGVVN